MRIARIARQVALYDASAPAQTCETVGETIKNPIDFDEVDTVNVAKLVGADSYPNMPGFEDFNRKFT